MTTLQKSALLLVLLFPTLDSIDSDGCKRKLTRSQAVARIADRTAAQQIM